MHSSLRSLGLVVAAILLAACPPSVPPTPSSAPEAEAVPVLKLTAIGTARADGTTGDLRASDLNASLRPAGAEGAIPRSVVIQLAVDVVGADAVGSVTEGTVVKVDPPTEGTVQFTSPSTLEWTPAEPLMPSTRYRVWLGSVGTSSGELQAPHKGAWITEFRTPGFVARQINLRSIDDNGEVVLELPFTGPFNLASLTKNTVFTLADGGRRVTPEYTVDSGRPEVALIQFNDSAVRSGVELDMVIADDRVTMRGRPRVQLNAVSQRVEIVAADLVSVVALRRKEGPSGHFVEVVCDDRSTDGYRPWWYDESLGEWFRVSPRCIPDAESAKASIRVEPALAFTVSPARHGFRILGNFERGSYTVTIDEGLKTEDGGTLKASFSTGITVPPRSPKVAFSAKGRYVPRSQWSEVGIRHLNAGEATLEVRQIPAENWRFWLSADNEAADERVSDLIASTTVPLVGPGDEYATTSVDLRSLIGTTPEGVFEVRIASGDSSDVTRLLGTDMNLVVKRAEDGRTWAWAVGLEDNRPLRNVAMELIRPSGTVLASCTTGPDGGCPMQAPSDELDETAPIALIATRGSDKTYLRFTDLELEAPDATTEGVEWSDDQAYRLAGWTDRGVYRPGDVLHLAGLLRDRNDRAPKKAVPVRMRVTDPNGNAMTERTLEPDAFGLLAADVEFGDYANTGRWQATFTVADAAIGTLSFHVEEFVPERLKVEAEPVASNVLAGQPIAVDVEATYLFGGLADGSPVELRCELRADPFQPTKNGGFRYGLWEEDGTPAPTDLGLASSEIGPDGTTRLSCPGLDHGGSLSGGGRVVARAAVFEAGSGRSTVGATSARLHPAAHWLGLSSGEDEVTANQPFTVSGVAVDWDGELTGKVNEVDVELFRLVEEYGLLWDRRTHTERWRRYLRRVGDGTTTAKVRDGKFTIPITPTEDGAGYLVRVTAGGATTELKLDGRGRRYWWWGGTDESVDATPRPLRPDTLELTLPEGARVGANLDGTFIAPYPGRALVTVETNEVVRHRWIEVERAGPTPFDFVVKAAVPNAYVSVLLLKDPHLESADALLPARAWGVGSVPMIRPELKREVAIDVPDEIQPNQTLTVGIDAGEGAGVVTVAAVDVGILSLTGFKTPDPLAQLFRARKLAVETFETVGWTLLTAPDGMSSATGGDAPAGMGRIQMVKPVALWSGPVALDDSGQATIELEVPSYRGALRVMAVASDATRTGAHSVDVLVRDPLTLQATTPRFLTGGDRIELPVFVTNTTKETRDVKVALAIEEIDVGGRVPAGPVVPPVEVTGPGVQTVMLAPGDSGTVVFKAHAARPVGAARFVVSASSGELRSKDTLEVPLLSSGVMSRRVERVELKTGTLNLTSMLEGFEPMTERSSIWVTTNPFGDVFGHLSWLIKYPYGCIEQTTSTTRPLLYVRRVFDHVDPSFAGDGGIDERVQHGLARVVSMQTASGGFSYWPGASTPVTWGTAYGVHLMLDAKEAGFDVPEESLTRAIDWLDEAMTGRNRTSYNEAYVHYVLARARRGHTGRIEQLIGELPVTGDGAHQEQAFLLKAALYVAGTRTYERELRTADLSPITDHRTNDWSFYSERRRRALNLDVMVDLFGRDPSTERLAPMVADSLKQHGSGWYTTQEVAWSMSSLGKWLADGSEDFGEATLTLAGSDVPPTAISEGSGERSWAVHRASEYRSAELSIDDVGDGELFLVVSSTGVLSDVEPSVGGSGLKLSRTWRRSDGYPIGEVEPVSELGDLIFTTVTLTNTTSKRQGNLALVDRFPAGWEVENPRLGRDHSPDWLDTDTTWSLDHMNVRDDRVEVFGALDPGEGVTFTYAVRAVTAGEFTMPSAYAEAMYDPRIWARTDADEATVLGPWSGVADGDE
ncbi:MAG: hypothetical protein GY898_15940 [Proteobacteria bacterium]|nr:hypothetical protein [Pseudomonadota bacterium]